MTRIPRTLMVKRLFPILLLIAIVLSISPVGLARAGNSFQQDPIVARAKQLLSEMSPEERVGQLFLVTFKGSTANPDSQVNDLIVNHHIGGVILAAGNDNFVDAPNTVPSAYQLVSQLQNAEWTASQPPSATEVAGTPTPAPSPTTPPASNYIPLFIGIQQSGDGYPGDQILNGMTDLPSPMALGATWNSSLAEQAGFIAGQELSAMGFNFFVGPSLDVLEAPDSTLGNGLDAGVFGGDPYWVGVMGSAYVTGVHTGSDGKMVVIANHFPGSGSADRPAGQEPATVRKSLEQLKQIELAPFFTVTGASQDPQSTVEGLMVSHIRYQGFQGNIRSTTRPVSFDPQALSQILALPAFSKWRGAGGLMVSDNLGSPTVRNFYSPGQQTFSARQVARDAFLAGNDLLYTGELESTETPDNYSTLLSIFDFFVQKYGEDSAFAQRVNDAVTRILAVKFHLYNYFSPSLVIPQQTGLSLLNQVQSQAVTSEVARESATLVSPDRLDLETVLPNPPGMHDQLVFLTDTRPQSQCSKCPESPMMEVDALQKVIMRLYGPQSGGQVLAGRMISYSFTSLATILPGGAGNPDLEGSLNQATWVIINMLDADPGQPQTELLRRFLAERQDILRDKHVIVFAFNAPYFLDATDISEITAYYGLYSKSASFVEVAARLLFRELSPVGYLPVSVPGVGYDLLSATSPDPNQLINVLYVPSTTVSATGTVTPQASPTPFFSEGQTVLVKTGVIVDHNGHPVPDGTGVNFTISISGTAGIYQQIPAITSLGVASATFTIPQAGLLNISATSDPAMSSVVLQMNVPNSGVGSSISYATPTEMSQPTITPTITPTLTPTPSSPLKRGYPGAGSWFSMVFLLGGLSFLAYWVGDQLASRRWGVRSAMCVILGGLLAYTYLAVRLPGAAGYLELTGWLGTMGVVFSGALVGGAAAYLWFRLVRESKTQSS